MAKCTQYVWRKWAGGQNLTKLFKKWIFDNLLSSVTPWEGCKFETYKKFFCNALTSKQARQVNIKDLKIVEPSEDTSDKFLWLWHLCILTKQNDDTNTFDEPEPRSGPLEPWENHQIACLLKLMPRAFLGKLHCDCFVLYTIQWLLFWSMF